MQARYGFILLVCFVVGGSVLPLLAQQKTDAEVVATLKGHSELVYTVAFSDDGKLLATGSFDNTIKLWDVPTGKELRTFGGNQGHNKMVLGVAFSPDNKYLASGGVDNQLKVWDVPVSTPLKSTPNSDEVNAVALAPDGKRLAAAGKDGTVRVFDLPDFKEFAKFDGHVGPALDVSFNNNGTILASIGLDKTVRFWNLGNKQAMGVIGAHATPVNTVLINPNNSATYTAGDDGVVKFWRFPPTPERKLTPHATPITAMALHPNGSQVVTASADKKVRHSQFTGQPIRELDGATAEITALALNNFIAAGTQDNKIFLWNAGDGKLLYKGDAHFGPVTSVAINPQNNQLMTAGTDGLVKTWTLPFAEQRAMVHPDGVVVSVMRGDGQRLFTGSTDKILRTWDIAQKSVERQYTGHPGPVSAVAISPNNQTLASGSSDGVIRFWDQNSAKVIGTIGAHVGVLTSLAINPASNQIVSTGVDGSVKLWQLPYNAPKVMNHPDQVTSLSVSANGARVVTGGNDKHVRTWNTGQGNQERDFAGPTLPIASVSINADGSMIAAGSADKSVHVWDANNGQLVRKVDLPAGVQAVAVSTDRNRVAAGVGNNIKVFNPNEKESKDPKDDKGKIQDVAGHQGAVTGLVFSPKNDLLFSASADKSIQAWALPKIEAKTKFNHVGPVTALAVSKDGTRLAGISDKIVKVWTIADGKEIATITLPAAAKDVSFSPDNNQLLLACVDNVGRVYQLDGALLEFFAHDGPVNAAAFVDAKHLVTASADKSARVWTTSLLWQNAFKGKVNQAIFTPQGDVISAGDDQMIRHIKAADGKEIKSFQAHTGPVAALSINGDGKVLATTGADKIAKVWTLADGKNTAQFPLPAPAESIALTPDGNRLAVGVGDPKTFSVDIYDIRLGQRIHAVSDHTAPVKSLEFLKDNRTLMSGSLDKKVNLSDINLQKVVLAHPGGTVHAEYHPNGTQAFTAGADKLLKLWDLNTGAEIRKFGPVPEPIKAAEASRDFAQATIGFGKTTKVYNLADGKELASFSHPADVLSVSMSADKNRVVTGSADKQSRIWDVKTGAEEEFFPQPEAVKVVSFHPQNTSIVSAGGKEAEVGSLNLLRALPADKGPVYALALNSNFAQLFVAGAEKVVKRFNSGSGGLEKTYTGPQATIRALAISKNNALIATGGDGKIVRLYNQNDGKELGTAKVEGVVESLDFAPNSLTLAGTTAAKTLHVWGVRYQFNQPTPDDFMKPVQGYSPTGVLKKVVIAPDNATLYTGGLDKNVQEWKLASPDPVRNFGHPNLVDVVAFQPGGSILASGCHDGKIRLYDIAGNKMVREINAHTEKDATMIYSVAFSPDGKNIVSGCFDGSLKMYDVGSGNLVREFKKYKEKDAEQGHRDPVYAVAFSPDGQLLASGSAGLERVIKVWNVADGKLIRDLDNPNLKTPPKSPSRSHPGWIYKLRFTKAGQLVSAGDAPKNQGYLAVWNPRDGKLLYSESMPLGSFFGLAVSPDSKMLALGAGPRGRPSPEFNSAYLLKIPGIGK